MGLVGLIQVHGLRQCLSKNMLNLFLNGLVDQFTLIVENLLPLFYSYVFALRSQIGCYLARVHSLLEEQSFQTRIFYIIHSLQLYELLASLHLLPRFLPKLVLKRL